VVCQAARACATPPLTFCDRKKPTGSKTAKSGKDENTKDLFEQESWSQNPVTMEKVLSVRARRRAPRPRPPALTWVAGGWAGRQGVHV